MSNSLNITRHSDKYPTQYIPAMPSSTCRQCVPHHCYLQHKGKKQDHFSGAQTHIQAFKKDWSERDQVLHTGTAKKKCAMTSTLHCPLATSRINLQGQEKGRPTDCSLDDRSCPWNTPTPGLSKASRVTQSHFTQPSTEAQRDSILWNPCNMSIL